MKISPARTAAFDILLRVETEKAFTSLLMPQFEETLPLPDRSLCHELVLGTLRRRLWLDRVVDELARGKKLDIEVRIALRLGIYQLRFLNKIPAYSAINESVELVRRARKTSAKGFVNAILRRASNNDLVLSFANDIERVAVTTSHPRWLIEKWAEAFGMEQAIKVAEVNNEHPKTAFRIIGEPAEEVKGLLAASDPSANVDGCYIAAKGDRRVFDLAQQSVVYIQDEASQMTASAVKIPENGRFLDVCAAPGGKTGAIVSRFGGRINWAVAGDLHWPRIEFLRDNCLRQGATAVKYVQYDAERSLPFADLIFDSVLVDAPCSGTGTIMHNPEIRYFLSLADIHELSRKQLQILSNASKLVKRGGSLVYSTCSLEIEENEQVVERFLDENEGFRKISPAVPFKFITVDGFARTWPQRDQMDGFFIAALEKE